MAPRIRTETDLAKALAAVTLRDPLLARVARDVEKLPLRLQPPGFKSLVSIIVNQQISRAAADTIFGRLENILRPFTAEAWLKVHDRRLASAGLSRPKRRHARAVAERVADGRLDLGRLPRLSDDRAREHLMAVPGIGRWTADIYLLFCMGRGDIWPKGDLALQVAAAATLGRAKRLSEQEMDALAEAWRPWRGVAARLFWAYYRSMRAQEAAQ